MRRWVARRRRASTRGRRRARRSSMKWPRCGHGSKARSEAWRSAGPGWYCGGEGMSMADKILAVILLAMSAASQILIRHADTALFYSWLFGALGAYEFVVGELRQRKERGGGT